MTDEYDVEEMRVYCGECDHFNGWICTLNIIAPCTTWKHYLDNGFRLFDEDAVLMPFLDILEIAHENYLMKKQPETEV